MSAAGVLAVVGAGALLAGLFLDWFEPGLSAWAAFELVDLLLAAIAVGVLAVALGASSDRPRLTALAAWLPAGGFAALALVIVSLINPPPTVVERSFEVGAAVSLAGAALLLVGAILATTELSLVITVRPRRRERPEPVEDVAPPTGDPGWEPPLEESPAAESPLKEPPLEEPPFEEPLEEPLEEPPEELPPEELPPEEPLEEPVAEAEAFEPTETSELVDEIIEPDEAEAEVETRRIRQRDRG